MDTQGTGSRESLSTPLLRAAVQPAEDQALPPIVLGRANDHDQERWNTAKPPENETGNAAQSQFDDVQTSDLRRSDGDQANAGPAFVEPATYGLGVSTQADRGPGDAHAEPSLLSYSATEAGTSGGADVASPRPTAASSRASKRPLIADAERSEPQARSRYEEISRRSSIFTVASAIGTVISGVAAAVSSYYAFETRDASHKAVLLTARIEALSSIDHAVHRYIDIYEDLLSLLESVTGKVEQQIKTELRQRTASAAQRRFERNQLEDDLKEVQELIAAGKEHVAVFSQSVSKVRMLFPRSFFDDFKVALDPLRGSSEIFMEWGRVMSELGSADARINRKKLEAALVNNSQLKEKLQVLSSSFEGARQDVDRAIARAADYAGYMRQP